MNRSTRKLALLGGGAGLGVGLMYLLDPQGGGRRRLHVPRAARLIAGTAGGALALAGLARMIRSTGATTAFARK